MGAAITPDALALLAALKQDFPLYAERCLKIRAKTGEVVPFRMNAAQRLVHQRLQEQIDRRRMVRALVLKGRQQGISTYTEGRFYWRVSMAFGRRAFILTHLAEATANLFGMTRRFHDHMPEVLKPVTVASSANSLRFGVLDSEFSVATAGSTGTGRSATAQYMHGSEVAFWDNAAEHMAGIGQIVPREPGTEIILESTGNGVGNLFHGMWQEAERGHGDYIAVFVPWMMQPEYVATPPADWSPSAYDGAAYAEHYRLTPEQAYWRELKIRDDFRGDVALFDQEYPAEPALAFRRQARESFIPPPLVAAARMPQKIEARGAKIMALDPAEMGADDSVCLMRQGRVVTHYRRYHGREAMELVGIVARLADEWQPDFLAVDATGLGSPIAGRLQELGYPVWRVVVGKRAQEEERYVLVRDELWGRMRDWFEDVPCQIPDDNLLAAELTSVPYTYDSSRRLKLESKERMRADGIQSPDGGDALALTFAVSASSGYKAKKVVRERPNWRA